MAETAEPEPESTPPSETTESPEETPTEEPRPETDIFARRAAAADDRARIALAGLESTPEPAEVPRGTFDTRLEALALAQGAAPGGILTPEEVVARAAVYEKYLTEGATNG